MALKFPGWLSPAALLRALSAGVALLLKRWRLVGVLGAAAVFFMVFGYLAIGYVIGRVETAERIRLYGVAVFENATDWIDRAIRGEAALKAQAAQWETQRSELQDLELNTISLVPRPVRAGAMTQLDAGVLLTTTAWGAFIGVNPETAETAPAAIASPINLETFRADPLWNTPGLDRNYFRVNDILAVKTGPRAYTLYATHHWFTPQCIEFRLSRTEITVDGVKARQSGGWETLFTATPCFQVMQEVSAFYLPFSGNLSGGRMLDFDAKRLLVTVGDQQVFEARGVDVAQDPGATMGKLVLIDKETGVAEIFASGERNAQGLIRDSKGRIWETEHGPHGGDELNLVRQGDNLGWPKVTYGINYDQRPWPGVPVEGRHEGYRKPVYVWMPSAGVSNLVEAPAHQFPNWAGDLLVGSLTGNTMFRVRLEGDDAIYAEPIRFGGHAIRDIDVMPDGKIAILDNRMAILLIRNGNGAGHSRIYNAGSAVLPRVNLARLSADRANHVRTGATLFARRCAECHSLVGAAGAGPQLRDVAGRRIGKLDGYAYSEALARAGGAWTEASLVRWLKAPESFGEGVAMANPGLTDAEARSISAYLVELARDNRRAKVATPIVTTHSGAGAAH